MREHMQIGEVAARTGLSLRTIRHYEEVGLVLPSARSAGGFRLYTEGDVARLDLVMRMKPLDLTLEEVRDALELVARAEAARDAGDPVPGDVARALAGLRERAVAHIAKVRSRLDRAEEFTDLLGRHADPGVPAAD